MTYYEPTYPSAALELAYEAWLDENDLEDNSDNWLEFQDDVLPAMAEDATLERGERAADIARFGP